MDTLVWQDLCTILQQPESITHAMTQAHSGAWVPQALQARHENLHKARGGLGQQQGLCVSDTGM